MTAVTSSEGERGSEECTVLCYQLSFSIRFKPVDVGVLIKPLRETFEFLFRRTFSVKQNTEFLGYIQVPIHHLVPAILCVPSGEMFDLEYVYVWKVEDIVKTDDPFCKGRSRKGFIQSN